MAEILITGGAGNFGRQLAKALRAEGHRLRILDLPSCDYSVFDGWEETHLFAGDIMDGVLLRQAVEGVDRVFHLAAILPPASERDRDRTFRVNVGGTRSLLDACSHAGRPPAVVLTSSVSVYGDTSALPGPIGPDHPVQPNDWYAESKVEAERLVTASGLPFANLRISGVVIPEFLDPPEPWAFMPEQRIELVALADVMEAMAALVGSESVGDRTLIIAGGPTWRVTGEAYVCRWAEIMEIPFEEMRFMDRPGWLNWYDTDRSQALLDYQRTSLDTFFEQLKTAVREALA